MLADTTGNLTIPVLIVDDDDDFRKVVVVIVGEAGYPVLEARDSVEALHILQTQPAPLIVLTDQHMPYLDGLNFLLRVLEQPSLLSGHAYVFMTAGNRTLLPDVQEVVARLHTLVLFKPFGIDEIFAALTLATNWLHASQQQQAPD